MERCLSDKNEYPDDNVLTRHLGKTKEVWDSFLALIKEDHPVFTTEWRYYNDGKSWLFKVTRKAKTICWVSVYPGLFRVTFYFNYRADEEIRSSLLPEEIKNRFLQGGEQGKIRGITAELRENSNLEKIRLLMEIKEKVK